MAFFWRELGEEYLDGPKKFGDNILKRNGIDGIYSGFVKVYQGRKGAFFGSKPVFLILHYAEGKVDGYVDLYFLTRSNYPFIVSTSRKDQQGCGTEITNSS